MIDMTQNKNHWYDGWFYDKLIAPNQDVTFVQMMRMIEEGSSIVDVGCGTGRFVFKVAERAGKVIGVDLSTKNINYANRLKNNSNNNKINFLHADALHLSEVLEEKFDYATISYVIHEMDISLRVPLLNELRKIANNIIIADFAIPMPYNKRGLLNRTAEFLAGQDHFKNFLSFSGNGGINGLVKDANLKLIEERTDKTKTSSIVKVY